MGSSSPIFRVKVFFLKFHHPVFVGHFEGRMICQFQAINDRSAKDWTLIGHRAVETKPLNHITWNTCWLATQPAVGRKTAWYLVFCMPAKTNRKSINPWTDKKVKYLFPMGCSNTAAAKRSGAARINCSWKEGPIHEPLGRVEIPTPWTFRYTYTSRIRFNKNKRLCLNIRPFKIISIWWSSVLLMRTRI